MRLRAAAAGVLLAASAVAGADRPVRKPLSGDERAALLALIKSVDVAEETDAVSPVELPWHADVLKSTDIAYVAYRLGLSALAAVPKSAAMYVRVVSRHDGVRSTAQRSALRAWAEHPGAPPPRPFETVVLGSGEMPIGVAARSGRRSIAAPAEASSLLEFEASQFERERAAAEAERRRAERRDPTVFPFEEYYFFDVQSAAVARALAVPPGEYDVFVALADRAHARTDAPTVVRHTIVVPDFWDLELRLSDLILARDVRTLGAPLKTRDQIEHPYTWGRAEVTPRATAAFTRDEVLSVVYQICNYGAPDTDITADYTFYRRDGAARTLFNRTTPQQLTNDDLPLASGWETQGFAMQSVPLRSFPAGDYELEVMVKDRLTRSTATQTITFTVN